MSDKECENDRCDTPGDASPDPEKPSELSRRQFLYIAGTVGLTPVAYAIEPLQSAQNRIKIKPQMASKADLDKAAALFQNPRFSILRPDDLLALEFECINLRLQPGPPPRLVRINPSQTAHVIVHFPPQHIAERAYYETTPDFKKDEKAPKKPSDPGGSEDPDSPPLQARLSGPTRLAFYVPREVTEIPLTLESLLSWHNLEPSLAGVALPPQVGAVMMAAKSPAASLGRPASADAVRLTPPAHIPMLFPGGAPRQNLYQARVANIPNKLNLSLLKIMPPASSQTAIELPYRLILSPHALNLWAHSVPAVTRNGRTELWHTRLAAAHPDGSMVETGSPYMAVRAIWSPDCNAKDPYEGPEHANAPFRMSLDRQDRHELVHLTSNYGMQYKGDAWQPKPVAVDRLMLTSLGGWLDVSGMWQPTPLSVEQWDHTATLGRDHYARVVYKGYLMPFGHAASLVKITERKFRKGDDDRPFAYLFQRMYLIVRQAEKRFPAPFQMHEGRELPFRKVRITTRMTPPLDDPQKSELIHDALQSAFWPRVRARDFRFHCIGTDWSGNSSEFMAPMAFVDATYAMDLKQMVKAVEDFNKQANLERRRMALRGQAVAFAAPQKRGDTDLEVKHMTFTARLPSPPFKREDGQKADQPLFFPVMHEAAVAIPALKAMVQLGGTDIRYPQTYLQNGLGGANKGEVFAAIPAAPELDFGAGRGAQSGGVATPSFPIVGLSRALGPVGGVRPDNVDNAMQAAESALNDVVHGRFDPEKFFDAKAKLLGGVLLRNIVKLVDNFMSHPEQALTIKQEILQDAAGAPAELHTLMHWKPRLQDCEIFIANRDGAAATLAMDARNITYFSGKEPYSEIKGELSDFTLDLVEPVITLIRIKFAKFTFSAKKGEKAVFDPRISAIEFAGPLGFIKDLLDKIKLPGMGGSGGLGQPIVEVDASRARLGYSFNIPDVGFGVFSLQNINFSAIVNLPFTGDPLLFRFAFNDRSNPFLLTVAMFGGGGFFAIELQPDGIKLIEGALEFGGSFAMDLGVASGGVSLMAGIYFKYENDNVTISGYVRCRGCLEVLGLISIAAEFYLALTYEQESNRVWGQAALTVKVKVLFFSTKVTLKVERSFRHSPPPLFADMMDESHWLEYCEAFA